MSFNQANLEEIAHRIMRPGFGILAADESPGTMGKRLASIDVDNSEDARRAYRDTIFAATPAFASGISGVITHEETLFQNSNDGRLFPEVINAAGAVVGIKVDKGTAGLPNQQNETMTLGLDGLSDRLEKYRNAGAEFAKWRAVLRIRSGGQQPSMSAVLANATSLALYAAATQQAGFVPIVEPEVLADGDHNIDDCAGATEAILRSVFSALSTVGVALEGVILKPNMITSGLDCKAKASVCEVAERTVRLFKNVVPAAVGGIAFLSGGQSEVEATEHLNAMNSSGEQLPWTLTFSYGRALQASALQAWKGNEENRSAAQQALERRVRMNSLACRGKWSQSAEDE